MSAVKYEIFRAELLAVYSAAKAPTTALKMKQALYELGSLPNVKTTADFTPATIADWINIHRSRSPNTNRGILGYWRAAFNYAKARGYLDRSPFEAVPLGRWLREDAPARKKHLTQEEIARIMEDLERKARRWEGHRLYALFATLAYTGLRRNEALYLQCGDVFLQEGFLELCERAKRFKTRNAGQPVPIPDALAAILEEWIPRTASIWLFPTKNGRSPWTGGSYGVRPLDQLQAAGKAVGIDGVCFQVLRHSWATHAESAWNLGEALIQLVLRHTRPQTQRHYRHADLVNLHRAVARIDFRPPPTSTRSEPTDRTATG